MIAARFIECTLATHSWPTGSLIAVRNTYIITGGKTVAELKEKRTYNTEIAMYAITILSSGKWSDKCKHTIWPTYVSRTNKWPHYGCYNRGNIFKTRATIRHTKL